MSIGELSCWRNVPLVNFFVTNCPVDCAVDELSVGELSVSKLPVEDLIPTHK